MSPIGPIEGFDALAVGMRAAAFITALQASGMALFIAVQRRALGESSAALTSQARFMTLLGLIIVVAHQLVEGARLSGDWSGVLDAQVQRLNWSQSPGIAAMTGVIGLTIQYVGLAWSGSAGRRLAVFGALTVAASFALTGHTTNAAVAPAVRLLLPLHVAIVAYWLGSVVALRNLTRIAKPQTLYSASQVFSAAAVWLVPVILPLGVGMLAGMLPDLASLRSTYGALLAAKFAGFSVLLMLGAVNRWRLVPALLREPVGTQHRYRFMLYAEYLILACVLSVTAVMTSLFSWH